MSDKSIKEVAKALSDPVVPHVLKKVEYVDVFCPRTGEVKRRRKKVTTVPADDGMTKQSDKSKACVHTILKQQAKGLFVGMHDNRPLEGEIPDVDSYFEAVKIVTDASNAFAELPLEIRQRFDNSPAKLSEFIHNPDNAEEVYSLGLANKPEIVEPTRVVIESDNTVPPDPPKE